MRPAAHVFTLPLHDDPPDASLYSRLGELLGLSTPLISEADLAARIEEGLPVGVVKTLCTQAGLSDIETSNLVAPRRTLKRRAQSASKTLSSQESDAAVRVARIIARAQQVFAGRPEYVSEWLREKNPALGGRAPLSTLVSETGARAVEEILIGIEHGMFA